MSMSQRSIAAYTTRRPYDSTPFRSHARSDLAPRRRGALGRRTHLRQRRTYSTRFNDFALEFYSFVLDGMLYHESDLDLEEHYTDTHGYTEVNFAAFAMIGMRFCPRIRSLHRQRIYCADPERDHGVLEPVLRRGRRSVNFRLIAEQWDRVGQFYAAFPAGHATASGRPRFGTGTALVAMADAARTRKGGIAARVPTR